jgi:hypothetical protein
MQILDSNWWDSHMPTRDELAELGFFPGDDWMSSSMDLDLERFRLRQRFVSEISFALPCREALEFIAGHSLRIVEVGAGTGFWSRHLARIGVDIVATDAQRGRYVHETGSLGEVLCMTASEAVAKYPDRDLLSVWPCYGQSWLAEAAERLSTGRLLFYIGEGSGGATADDRFHALVDEAFDHVARFEMVQFSGIHDDLHVYRKN